MLQTLPENVAQTNVILVAVIVWMAKMGWEFVKHDILKRDAPAAATNEMAQAFRSMSDELHQSLLKLQNQYTAMIASVTQMHTALTGLDGQNGLMGEMRIIRDRVHGMEGDIGLLTGTTKSNLEQIQELRRLIRP